MPLGRDKKAIKIISHAVVASYLLLRYSVPKGTGNYYLLFTAISAYPWHACMAAYNITSQEGCFTDSLHPFLASPTGKIR